MVEDSEESVVVVVVDDDRSSWDTSERVVVFRWISHMEWQILLATVMPTATSSRYLDYSQIPMFIIIWLVSIYFGRNKNEILIIVLTF